MVSFVVLRLLRGLERMPGLFWQGILMRRRRENRIEATGQASGGAAYAGNGIDGQDSAGALNFDASSSEGEDPAYDPDAEAAPSGEESAIPRKPRRKKPRKRRRTQTEDMISE